MIRTVLLALALALAVRARADGSIRRFAVVAGASLGGAGRTPLRYATSDARDVSRVLRRLGGVARGDLVLVEEPDPDRLRGAIASVAGEAERARAAGRRVELFLYYSGHSDEDGLLLGGSRLPYADLRRELERVRADVRVAILDSCASGAMTRAKGGVHRPPFLLDASSRVSGSAILTSSAADEAAQESDRLRASFFTHALLTGLRGAADASGDGVVTLSEAYQFAFRETLARTEGTQAGPQHATYDMDLAGSGDVVMTDLRGADALLVVPEALEGRVFVRNVEGQLVAELRKVRGARVELALEEGRYQVRVARGARLLEVPVVLSPAGRVVLDEASLRPVPLEATASRGDAPAAGGDALAAAAPAAAPLAVAVAPVPPAVAPPVPSPAPASDHASLFTARYLAGVRGGIVSSRREGLELGSSTEAAVAAWYGEFLGLELSSGYQRVSGRLTARMPEGPLEYGGRVRDVMTMVPTRLSLLLGLPTRSLRPYLLAGVGATWVQLQRFSLEPGLKDPTPPHRLLDHGLFKTFHAGVGLEARLSRSISALVDVRWTIGGATLIQQWIPLDTVSATAGLAWTF
jgi:hypothetical protein